MTSLIILHYHITSTANDNNIYTSPCNRTHTDKRGTVPDRCVKNRTRDGQLKGKEHAAELDVPTNRREPLTICLMTGCRVRIVDLVVKLNVDKGKVAVTPIYFTFPLTVDVHGCHQHNVPNLAQHNDTVTRSMAIFHAQHG